jgi:transposase
MPESNSTRYKAFSLEQKIRILVSYKLKPIEQSIRAFCRIFEVSPRTLDGWLEKFDDGTLTIDKRSLNKRPIQIQSDAFVEAVDAELRQTGLTTIGRIRQKLFDTFPYSLSTYYKIVHRLQYSFKRVKPYTLPNRLDPVAEMARLLVKQAELRAYGIENVVSIDECPFYEEMHPRYGWSKLGKSCTVRTNAIRTKCHSIISAMSSDGRFFYRVVDSGNRETFLAFIKQSVMRHFPRHKYLLMDNARLHHCKEVKEYIESRGKIALYTIPYTPELNPIENGFSVLKQHVRQEKPKNKQELLKALRASKRELTGDKCRHMFMKSFGLTDYQIIR